MKHLWRRLLLLAGACAIVAASFFGTLLVLDHWPYKNRDSLRASDARALKSALEKFHAAHGNYPQPFPANPVTDLKAALVDGGYLPSIPDDPLWGRTENQYYYVSGGPSYGLLFHLEAANGKIPAGGRCITGVGTAGTGWWGQPPDCPF
jgi:hypothetical protein